MIVHETHCRRNKRVGRRCEWVGCKKSRIVSAEQRPKKKAMDVRTDCPVSIFRRAPCRHRRVPNNRIAEATRHKVKARRLMEENIFDYESAHMQWRCRPCKSSCNYAPHISVLALPNSRTITFRNNCITCKEVAA